MTKRYETEMFGLPIIMRHDYEDAEILAKINSYRKRSIDSLDKFLTNVPGSENFSSFLDIGAGDTHDMEHFKSLHPHYDVKGIDFFLEDWEYTDDLIKMDWYKIGQLLPQKDVIYINHSLEHSANIYKLMEAVVKCHTKGGVLFIAVPDGNSPFGYSITSSTTHFSVLTEGFLNTTLQRFGYNVAVEKREFREGSPELWAFAIKQS